ncbi:hypothetical protein JCM11957_15620 [Caminibacter profundus]
MKKNRFKKVVYHSMRLEGYKINLTEKKLKEIKSKYNVKVHV